MVRTKVLLVDDEAGIRRFVSAGLRAEGHEVSLAADGAEVLKSVEATVPDLVILDIRMPNVDGYEVCLRIREWSQVPVMMTNILSKLSANDRTHAVVLAYRLGVLNLEDRAAH